MSLNSFLATKKNTQQWQRLTDTLKTAHTKLVVEARQQAELFVPISEILAELTVWLRENNEAKITQNQVKLTNLQASFIHWLVALTPLTLLVGGGFLWRISGRLKG